MSSRTLQVLHNPLKEWMTVVINEVYNANETEIIRFPDKSIPAEGVLLLVRTDPINTDLAVAHNLGETDQEFGYDSNVMYLVLEKLNIPNNNNWLLILR